VIIELLSQSTADEDLTVKKDIYEQTFRTPEYYCYDPETLTLSGWRLNHEHYQPIAPNDQGWLWCEQLKLWLGVWIDGNSTTNERQLTQMWDILDEYGTDPFEGVVGANEILFRKEMTESQVINLIGEVRTNLSARGLGDFPVATSDLGSSFTTNLVRAVDVIMANIHPFFGGVPVEQAAGWTWNFWQNVDVPLTRGMTGKTHIISEVGWPSAGGNDCGLTTKCPDSTSGSVAGISEINRFLDDWVCGSMANGTNYFYFEAFDEPWKVMFNTPGQEWEDKWGLMDVDRNLKPGIVIPDCGGRTI